MAVSESLQSAQRYRSTRRGTALVVGAFVATIGFAPRILAVPGGSGSTAQQLMASVSAAVKQQSAVSEEVEQVVNIGKAHVRTTETISLGLHAGEYQKIQRGTLHASGTLIVIKNRVYLRGNADFLATVLGFNSVAAQSEEGRWVGGVTSAFPDPTLDLARLKVNEDAYIIPIMTPPLKLIAPRLVDGQRVVGIQSTTSVHGQLDTTTFFITTKREPLPVEVINAAGNGGYRDVRRFASWTKQPQVVAPHSWVALKQNWLSR
jgi:hypothetical protein